MNVITSEIPHPGKILTISSFVLAPQILFFVCSDSRHKLPVLFDIPASPVVRLPGTKLKHEIVFLVKNLQVILVTVLGLPWQKRPGFSSSSLPSIFFSLWISHLISHSSFLLVCQMFFVDLLSPRWAALHSSMHTLTKVLLSTNMETRLTPTLSVLRIGIYFV